MKCRNVRKSLVELLDPVVGRPFSVELERHLEGCPECSTWLDEVQGALDLIRPAQQLRANSDFKESVMQKIVAMDVVRREPAARKGFEIGWWRPVTAAAAAALVAFLLLGVFLNPAGPGYALEQTIKANRGVRSIHIVNDLGGEMTEAWAEFDGAGNPIHLRMDFPVTADGPKVVLWEKELAEVWFKKKNSVVVVREPDLLASFPKNFFDPKLIVEDLYEKQAAGEIRIEVEEPSVEGEPILLRVTQADDPNSEKIFHVDPETNLLQRMIVSATATGEAKSLGSVRYLEYNRPIDPKVFEPEIPADAMRVDQATQEIGLDQGDLSDEQIAIEVVREFFGALIAKDYAKAGRLMEGTPASKMEEFFGKMNFIRIVSIGEPSPHSQTRSLRVPCKVEVEANGAKSVFEPHGPFVRQVHNQPGRWSIIGGI